MPEFSEKLDDAASHVREHIDQEKQAAKTEEQMRVEARRVREEAVAKTHAIAMRLNQKFIEPIVKQVQTKIRGGIAHEYSDKKDHFAAWSLEFANGELLALKIHFDESSVWLSAEARCLSKGIVYSEKSELFDCAQFEETKAQNWIESHALEAYEAFGQHALAVRNQPPIVRYKQSDP